MDYCISNRLAFGPLAALEDEVAHSSQPIARVLIIHALTGQATPHVIVSAHFPVLILFDEAVGTCASPEKLEAG